jgi:hypothetical protein
VLPSERGNSLLLRRSVIELDHGIKYTLGLFGALCVWNEELHACGPYINFEGLRFSILIRRLLTMLESAEEGECDAQLVY